MDKPVDQKLETVRNLLKNPVLERKHSSGDLQSRLKTRKILGVGETDNGDIHRSKISQVLGHNEHLYVRFPRCYYLWYFTMAIMYTGSGLANILLPSTNSEKKLTKLNDEDLFHSTDISNKYYGSALLGFSTLLWNLWGTADKSLARSMMLAMAIVQILQFGALSSYLWQEEIWDKKLKWQLLTSLVTAIGNTYYCWAIGSSTAGLRKSASYKDLKEIQQSETPICPECSSDLKQQEQSKKTE